MSAAADRQFRAVAEGGEIVGWLRSGPRDRPPLLLLHGGPGLSDYLGSLADELDGLAPIARYQQRGVAPSVIGGDKSVDGHVADALAVLDELGWQQAVLVGHSWGGHLAMHFAVAHPERVRAQVILDPLGAVGDGGTVALGIGLRARMPAETAARLDEIDAVEYPTEELQLTWMRLAWPYYFGEPDRAPPMPDLRHDPESGRTWDSIAEHFGRRTLERGLPGVARPMLLLSGDRSPIPLVESERTVALMSDARLVVHRGRGHFGWLEEPGFVGAQVEQLLATLTS